MSGLRARISAILDAMPEHNTVAEHARVLDEIMAAVAAGERRDGIYLQSGVTVTKAMGAGTQTYPLREPVTVSEPGIYDVEIHSDGTASVTRRGVAR